MSFEAKLKYVDSLNYGMWRRWREFSKKEPTAHKTSSVLLLFFSLSIVSPTLHHGVNDKINIQ